MNVHPFFVRSLLLSALSLPVASMAHAQKGKKAEPELPGTVVDVDAQASKSFRMGIARATGPKLFANTVTKTARRDFTLVPGFKVIPADSAEVQKEGLAMSPSLWANIGVDGVIKAKVANQGRRLKLSMRFYRAHDGKPALKKDYLGPRGKVREWVHTFGNEVIGMLTGRKGVFGTQLAFARRRGPGDKTVQTVDMDGEALKQVGTAKGVSMLPEFGPKNSIWYTRVTTGGTFITHSEKGTKPVIKSDGLNMAPAVCGNRVFFVSSRDGNSEIYSSDLKGRNMRRLTRHPAIDVSPTCGPPGKVAFVSARHGSPQIFVMGADGSDQKRVTFKGAHNQTPSYCPDPAKPLVAFTGRDGFGLDIFIVNLATKQYTRLTQGQGHNKDPSFSPDCRMVAFVSNRKGAPGIYVSSVNGFNQHKVVSGKAETVRWSRY